MFSDFEALKCKFSRNLWFQANVGSWGTKKFWNGGFREGSGGCERRVLRAAHNCTPFSAEYPPPPPAPGSNMVKIQSVKLKVKVCSVLQNFKAENCGKLACQTAANDFWGSHAESLMWVQAGIFEVQSTQIGLVICCIGNTSQPHFLLISCLLFF